MRKPRILYIDDEIGAARLLGRNLELMGRYNVRVENWAEDAVHIAKEYRPDLVLLDILMPRMSGGDVAAVFEQDPELRQIPVLFFTAAVWRHQVEENDGVICDHPCLAKPSDMREIVNFIEQNLPAPLTGLGRT